MSGPGGDPPATGADGQLPPVAPEQAEPPDPAAQLDALWDVPEGRLLFYTAVRESVSLDGWYKGGACFLVCGGPSLLGMNLALLQTPGVVTWAMNNAWSALDALPGRPRPRLWSCIDPIERFCWRGMVDPSIVKVLPLQLAPQRLRFLDGTVWRQSRLRVRDCPSVWYYQRNCRFNPADFFAQASVCCGNNDGETDALGVTGLRSVMLATVRLIHALGFRTINLLGCDFRMGGGGRDYAAVQRRDGPTVAHNNALFAGLNTRFAALAPYLELEGVRVFNCTPDSGLAAFPFRPLHEAVREATAWTAGPLEAEGWYDRQPTADELRDRDRWQWESPGAGAD